MLRLRVLQEVPQVVKPGDSIKFTISCTNESGALQRLGSGAKLSVKLCTVDGVEALDAGKLEVSSSGEAVLDTTIPSGKLDNRAIRVKLTPLSEWPLIPSSAKEEKVTKSVPTALVRVCAVLSPAITVSKSAQAAASPSTDLSLGSCIVHFPPPSGSGLSLRIFEGHSAVSPGFGSIVWDCALAVLHAMGGRAGEGGKAGKGKSLVPTQGPVSLSSYLPCPAGGGMQAQGAKKSSAQRSSPWKGLRVVDLGCGTGVLGIAAGSLGATVACTDLPSMLPLTWANVKANAELIKGGGGTVTCLPLLWGGEGAQSDAAIPLAGVDADSVLNTTTLGPLPVGSRGVEEGATVTANSGKKRILPAQLEGMLAADSPTSIYMRCPVDVVLASEVAYRPEAFEPLLSTFTSLTGAEVLGLPEAGDQGTGCTASADAAEGQRTVIVEDATRPSASCPVLILAARRRACMDLCDFLALVRGTFHVLPLAGVREGWAGKEEDWASLTGTPSELDVPASSASWASTDPLQAFVARASLLSKTGWPPMLFVAWPKVRRQTRQEAR